ncbi:Hypothetical_protein [Hexamita inflata]|uniref:Hypothetical_protein n=1 Tax=Hexamita inflata TaxID=28002 RepID=A0AA86RCW6_9EUKA|nr:Hypothetical protein HINF_LOCUS58447 [Hexamita inflata]
MLLLEISKQVAFSSLPNPQLVKYHMDKCIFLSKSVFYKYSCSVDNFQLTMTDFVSSIEYPDLSQKISVHMARVPRILQRPLVAQSSVSFYTQDADFNLVSVDFETSLFKLQVSADIQSVGARVTYCYSNEEEYYKTKQHRFQKLKNSCVRQMLTSSGSFYLRKLYNIIHVEKLNGFRVEYLKNTSLPDYFILTEESILLFGRETAVFWAKNESVQKISVLNQKQFIKEMTKINRFDAEHVLDAEWKIVSLEEFIRRGRDTGDAGAKQLIKRMFVVLAAAFVWAKN